ncbi:hypothetical protein BV25DRAFT_1821652 [Artomyces pyxidatus]|uniref:Uncharacterized protein n=1 Tax=Artomyces pyxidatus TaxID=48021 RepID=A0ACB8TCQ1_9AGAM|nr:hypothetical protein BV25DRAFT_1821652 [Artomyces pyxidatus]
MAAQQNAQRGLDQSTNAPQYPPSNYVSTALGLDELQLPSGKIFDNLPFLAQPHSGFAQPSDMVNNSFALPFDFNSGPSAYGSQHPSSSDQLSLPTSFFKTEDSPYTRPSPYPLYSKGTQGPSSSKAPEPAAAEDPNAMFRFNPAWKAFMDSIPMVNTDTEESLWAAAFAESASPSTSDAEKQQDPVVRDGSSQTM